LPQYTTEELKKLEEEIPEENSEDAEIYHIKQVHARRQVLQEHVKTKQDAAGKKMVQRSIVRNIIFYTFSKK
jgi:hypothetical protein